MFEAKTPHLALMGVESVAGRWTDTPWTKTDAEKFQAAAHEASHEDIIQFSFSLSKRNSHKKTGTD